MPVLFDLHAERERLAVLAEAPGGGHTLELRSLSGERLGKIGAQYLPLYSQWSPDGATLALDSNDGVVYLYRPGAAEPEAAFTNPALQAGFCEWAADGKRLVFSAYDKAQHTPPRIYTLALDSGRVAQLTDDAKTVDRFPHWSPDGNWVAFQRQFMDEPELPRRAYVADVQTGECRPLLNEAESDYVTGRFGWSRDSSAVLVTQNRQGRNRLAVVRVADQTITWSYESETVHSGAFSPNGERILCMCRDELLWFAYPEGTRLARLSLADKSPVGIALTGPKVGFDRQAESIYFLGENHNLYRWQTGGACETFIENRPLEKPAFTHEEYFVTARDGRRVPVQRFIPPEPKAPAILFVHGGPGGAIDPNDAFMLGLLAEGVEFVCAAYRGSDGYGAEHAEANRGECGKADVWDVLAAGLDWKQRTGGKRPLILAGYSYGGFLTLLALAQEEIPWAGGIAMWTVSGMHRLGLQLQRAFPSEAGARAQAEIERSPLAQAGRIRVPLIIFHGALDTTATVEEVETIQARVTAGGGACELIVYADDTHGLVRHRDEIQARVLRFLDMLTE